jgi:fucose permease
MLTSNRISEFQVVGLSYISFVVLGLPGAILGVAWPSIRETFSLSLDAVGILLTASTIGYLVSSFFSGRVISRLGTGLTLSLSSLVAGVGLLGYGFAPSWWFMILIGLGGGLGTGTIDAGLNLYFARVYGPRLMNWLHAAFGLGAALGPLLITALLNSQQSWRTGYLIVGTFQLIMAASFALTIRCWQNFGASIDTPEAPQQDDISLIDTIRQPLVWLSVLLFAFAAGAELVVGQWVYVLFTQARGIDTNTAGQWVSIYWASFTVGRIVFGIVANRLPINRSISAVMVITILGALLIWANLSDAASLVGLITVGFMIGPIFPLLISTTPDRLGQHANNAVGIQVSAASIGIAALPALGGVLAERIGIDSIAPFIAAIAVITLVLYQLASVRQISPVAKTKPVLAD